MLESVNIIVVKLKQDMHSVQLVLYSNLEHDTIIMTILRLSISTESFHKIFWIKLLAGKQMHVQSWQ